MERSITSTRWSAASFLQLLALGRPLHLIGGILFTTLGLAIARYSGFDIDWTTALVGLFVVLSMQLMTHYSNEYFDLEADKANTTPTRWAGGSRVLVDGHIAPRIALWVALGFAGLAAIGSVILLFWLSSAPLQSALLLLLALTLAWGYSSPPLWLNQRALGEISAAVLIPGLTLLMGFQLQAGDIFWLPLLAAIPLSLFQFLMLLAINFPDRVSDAAVGKVTLVVLLGAQRAAWLYLAVLPLAYVLLPVLWAAGLPWPVPAMILLSAPIAAWLWWQIWKGAWDQPATWDALGFWSIGLLIGTALLELIGFLLLL